MTLSIDYPWLAKEPGPRILLEFLKLYGIKEVPGRGKSNPTIIGWAKELGQKVGMDYKEDDDPWCGLATGIAAFRAGQIPPAICVRAKEWAKFGIPAEGGPKLGDVLVFTREGGGHVGLYIGEDATRYYVLGGNQGNMVSIAPIDKKRLFAARRPIYLKNEVVSKVRAIQITNGKASSKNEA